MMNQARRWLNKIRQLDLPAKVRIMNVCGGHERAITMAGLRSALPQNIQLIPGPGCPVCICPEEDIFDAMQLALQQPIVLLVFGDLLRVPLNVAKNECRTLAQAKAAGADIRVIASPVQAVSIANQHPDLQVVFFAAGFETTMAPVAAMVSAGIPDNLSLLLSGRLTWPAVAMLLQSDTPGFDALIAPGHVATVMGANEWEFVVNRFGIASAVAGFTPLSLLAAFYSTLRQIVEQRPMLDNCYAEVVQAQGNVTAQRILHQVMAVQDANWRGVGSIAQSGFCLNKEYEIYDSRKRFAGFFTQLSQHSVRRRAGQMPPGCDCAKVVLGKYAPNQCRLYGNACKPGTPVGPCMVSEEGACRIWWSGGVTQGVATEIS